MAIARYIPSRLRLQQFAKTATLLSVIASMLLSQAAAAISAQDLSSVLQHSELYNATCTSSSSTTPSGALPSTVPTAFASIFEAAASQYNVPPSLVAAIFMEENGLENSGTSWPDPTSESWPTSSAGAQGPFQFLPSTFQSEQAPGKTDINNLTDAAYAAANYLSSNGGKLPNPNLQTAISAYNHSSSYVSAVTQLYNQLGGASSATGGPANSGTSSIDVTSVAQKYGLQSAIVEEVGGTVLGSYQANQPPITPASTMKLVIADTLLQSNVDLSEVIPVTPDLLYGGDNDLPGTPSSISVGDALMDALQVSSNVGANVMIKALGGPSGFTSKANGLGYNGTSIQFYYSPSDPPANKSTIGDEADAMDHLLSSNGTGYSIAQQALKSAAQNDNHYNVSDEANKWAGTSQVAGNVGEFGINGSQYIIGLYYNGSDASSAAINAIQQGSAALASLIQSSAGAASSGASGGCCPSSGSLGVNGDSTGSTSGVWSSGLSAPYIVEQYAINVLEDLAQKKGVPQSSAVTQQHVLALVTWAQIEGGDIMNSDLFNLYNTSENGAGLGGVTQSTGNMAYPSFDQGVEATARTLASGHGGMLNVLLNPSSTAQQFAHAESYSGTSSYPGTQEWAAAAESDPSGYENSTWDPALQQVQNNYKSVAALIIGTPALEEQTNQTDPSLLQFSGSGSVSGVGASSTGSCSATASPDASGIVQEALSLAWPDGSHVPPTQPTPAYSQALAKYNSAGYSLTGGLGDDCGVFVSTVMRATGADPNYPASGTGAQYTYVESHPSLYQVSTLTNLGQLQPGDIVILGGAGGAGAAGHTWIYVGKQPNGDYSASASLGSRTANLDTDPISLDLSGGAPIYARLK
ncbi:MAG TPA: serine hydrolase [Candidatus Saccharimonadales bacterium]|nr:serine hydrolase [Candidatus Saccharimonadales bacterium]